MEIPSPAQGPSLSPRKLCAEWPSHGKVNSPLLGHLLCQAKPTWDFPPPKPCLPAAHLHTGLVV